MKYSKYLIMSIAVVSFLNCSSTKKGSEIKLDGAPVTVAGVTFHPPSNWKSLGPSGMRQADYVLGPLDKDSDSATVAIFYFGSEYGGTAEENIERWIGQMSLPEGGDPHKKAWRTEETISGMKMNMVELAGTYNAPMGGMMQAESVRKDDYFMAAVVLEAPQGKVFLKLTGPEHTARVMLEGYTNMIREVNRAAL